MTYDNSSHGRPPQPPRRPGGGFFDSIRNTGFRRTVDGRWIGGVSGAIAERTGVDRTLVRGLTVVLCLFFGIGVLLYGLAWLFLPEPDGRIHAEGVLHGVWSGGFIGSCIVVVLGIGNPGFHAPFLFWPGGHGFWGWFGPALGIAIVVAIIIYAVNHRGDSKDRGNQQGPGSAQDPGTAGGPNGPNPPMGPDGGPAGPRAPDAATTTGVAAPDAATTTDAESGIAEQDETLAVPAPDYGDTSPRPSYRAGMLASAQTAQYGAPPTSSWQSTATRPMTPPPPPAPRMITKPAGGPMTLLFSGLAIIGAAAGWLVDRSVGLPGNGHLIAVGIGVAVLGIGIILAGAWGRRGGGMTGWAWIGLVLACLVALVPAAGRVAAVQDGSWTPTTVASAEHGYSVGIGTTTVDLSDLTVPPSGTVTVPVNSGIGDVKVVLPADTTAKVQMMGAGQWNGGSARVPNGANRGPAGTQTMHYGDGPAHLIVKIRMGVGSISVNKSEDQGVTS